MEPEHVATWEAALWRIHRVAGRHPLAWDEFRTFGPVSSCRWDPHPAPAGDHPSAAVLYAAGDPGTAFAEVFQATRLIDLDPTAALTGWLPTRPLALLDLTGSDWALHHGAAASLAQSDRATCRAWARAVLAQHGETLDGILAPSTLTGDPMVVLFPRAADSLPEAPAFSRPLDHLDVAGIAVRVADRLRWPVV